MISSLGGCRQPDKYSYGIPHEYFLRWGTSRGKAFQLNGFANLIWFFIRWWFSFLHMFQLFRKGFIFGEATSSHFFRVIALTQQSLFRSCYFGKLYLQFFFWISTFWERLLFKNKLPSVAATSSEELIFHNILLQKTYYFIATLPFHSYFSYLLVTNSVSSVPVTYT